MIEELIRQVDLLKKIVDGLIKPELGGTWADWTPIVTQGVAVTSTITNARYSTVNRIVTILAELTVTSAGTGGLTISISGIPTAIQPANPSDRLVIGTAIITDINVANYHAALIAAGADDWRFISNGVTGFVGATPNFGLVNTDRISFMGVYER